MTRLKEIRQERELTQSFLSMMAEVPLKSIQKYESGERDLRKAEAATVNRLAHALNVSVDELLDYQHISKEQLKEDVKKYDMDERGAINYCLGYCGMVDKTIYSLIREILEELEE